MKGFFYKILSDFEVERNKCEVEVRQYNIKPLSLHQRIHQYDHARAQNVLRITGCNTHFDASEYRSSGNFSLGEAHSWSAFCLPDLPEKPPPGEKAEFAYASTFTNTHLLATYMYYLLLLAARDIFIKWRE